MREGLGERVGALVCLVRWEDRHILRNKILLKQLTSSEERVTVATLAQEDEGALIRGA